MSVMEFKSRKQGRTTILEVNNAQIIRGGSFCNFEGRGDKYNREGDRNFAIRIPNEEIAQQLMDDVNEYGVGWNVKIRPAREEGEEPFIFLKIKLKYNRETGRGPAVYLETNGKMTRLTEDTIGCLDHIDIREVSLDIRSYDDVINSNPCRAAYLQSMRVVQEIDRFEAMYADDRYDYED
jgi:hypothetical protein